jgi:dUTP pyrophosphatase
MDLHAATSEAVVIAPRARHLFPTGLSFAIPDGFEGQVRPRSGLAAKLGVTVLNAPGTVDSDYRGEVMVLLVNTSDVAATIRPLERIAQLVFAKVTRAELELVDALDETARGAGGYGSTGR